MKYLFPLLFVFAIVHTQTKKQELNLMPWPQKIEVSNAVFLLNKDFKINIKGHPNTRIFKAATQFLRRLDERTALFFNQGFITKLNEFPEASVQINCLREGKVGITEDESYQLTVISNKITINATTDLGALHALETLSQLLQNNATQFYFPSVEINDNPRFAWRGLMIDASRHFQPVAVIKRNLDGMAAMKMNVFHWHLADDQGWRIEIKKHPKLTELASNGSFYTQE
ncbi:MAG: family 20 glycosylhydrolase, partial [Flavobacterium sp.]